MELTITRFVRADGEGALRAFCDISIGGLVLVKGIRVVEGREGLFISMPRQQNKLGKWYDSVVPLCPDLRDRMTRVVLDAYLQQPQKLVAG
jgi:stage V sporulation protein G